MKNILKTIFFGVLALLGARHLEGAAEAVQDDLNNVPIWEKAEQKEPDIFKAIRTKPFAEIQKMVADNPNVLISKNGAFETTLIQAVKLLRPMVVELILNTKVKILGSDFDIINGVDENGNTALCRAFAGLRYNTQDVPNAERARLFRTIFNLLIAADANQKVECPILESDKSKEQFQKMIAEYKQSVAESLNQHLGNPRQGPGFTVLQYLDLAPIKPATEEEEKRTQEQSVKATQQTSSTSSQSGSALAGARPLDADDESDMDRPE